MKKQLLFPIVLLFLFSNHLLAQETKIQLPTTDSTSSFNVTKSDDSILMKVRADGRVGFGIEFPTVEVDVAGTLKTTGFSLSTGAVNGYVLTSNALGFASWQPLTSSQWTTVDSNIYFNTGNVGIGTSNPGAKLHVYGEAAGIALTNAGAPPNNQSWSLSAANANGRFMFRNHSAVQIMVLEQGGNVGIGTPSPVAKLDIVGNIKITDGTEGLDKVLTSDASGVASWQSLPSGMVGSGTSDYISKFTSANSIGNSIIYESSGKLGIGTTTPEFKLSLEDDGGIIASGTYDSGVDLTTSGAGTRFIWYPKKAAFRAGRVEGDQWNDANIGVYSTAMGVNTTASGDYSTAMGGATTASGKASTAMGALTTADGDYSTAMGSHTTASGYASTAMGVHTNAIGETSTAMGAVTTASGDYSTAMGYYTTASGENSTAMGVNTTASGNASTAIGKYNVGLTNAIFEIGIGNSSSKKNAITVLNDGKVGIGTTTPEFKLSLEDDGGIIASGTYDSGVDLTTSGAGTRLMWYPKKAAFRAGRVEGDQWNDANIGDYSTAMGQNTTASGDYSTSIGYYATASGIYSTSMGWVTTAIGDYSTARGSGTTASGNVSTAMGVNTTASNYASTAMGNETTASGHISTAMGFSSTASGWGSMAMGFNITASGDYSTAMGWVTTASGNYSTAMGIHTTAIGDSSTAIGKYNVGLTNSIFEIGIGNSSSKKNAMTVLNDGNVGIGTTAPATKLAVNGLTGTSSYNNVKVDPATGDFYYESSSIRYKDDIQELNYDFNRILNVKPKRYIDRESRQGEIGYIAEDFDELELKDLVIYDENREPNGLKYDRITLYLVEIIKEQQKEIDELQDAIALISAKIRE